MKAQVPSQEGIRLAVFEEPRCFALKNDLQKQHKIETPNSGELSPSSVHTDLFLQTSFLQIFAITSFYHQKICSARVTEMDKLLRVLTAEAQSSIPNTHRYAEAHNCIYSRPLGSDSQTSAGTCTPVHTPPHRHIEKHIIKNNIIF